MSVILICLHFHDLFSNFRNVLGASLPSLNGGTFVTVRSSDPQYKSLRGHCLVSGSIVAESQWWNVCYSEIQRPPVQVFEGSLSCVWEHRCRVSVVERLLQ